MRDASLEIAPGEIVAVVGGRGSGKTTLLKVAIGLEHPDAGNVMIDGVRLSSLSDRELTLLRRERVGCVWTSVAPVGRSSVVDLVALPLRMKSGDGRSALAEAERVLSAIEATHFADAAVEELSDGERRLVAIAQALVTKPCLLLLDQPATDLGLSEEKHLLDVLASLARDANVAVLMTARNFTEAVAADAVATIRDGCVRRGNPTSNESGAAEVLQLDARRREPRGGDADA